MCSDDDDIETCVCPCHTELERWERFKEAARLEKSWMNERMNWMLVPQGVLFGALAWIMKLSTEAAVSPDTVGQLKKLAAMISTLGVVLALVGLVGAVAAGFMHFLWTTEINKIAKTNPTDKPVFTFGMKPHWPARTTSVMPSVVAFAFFCTWATFITTYFEKPKICDIGGVIVAAIVIVGLIICCVIQRGKTLQNK